MPTTSRRTAELGTENAFVVLAEVNELVRQGKDVISFCIGQPDFPTPVNVQDAAIRAIREGSTAIRRRRGSTSCARPPRGTWARMRGLDIGPEHVVVGAGAKPFIAYAILATTDYGVGDEVVYPNPGFPIYESQIRAHGAVPVPLHLREARNFAFDPADLEAKLTPRTKLADPELAAQPDRRHPHPPRPGGDRGDPAPASRRLGLRGRDLLAPLLRGRVRLDRVVPRNVRADDRLRRGVEDLGDDRLAARLRGEPACWRRSSPAG